MTDADRLREMRGHSGVDPHAVAAGTVPSNRADRRLAARVLREEAARDAARRHR